MENNNKRLTISVFFYILKLSLTKETNGEAFGTLFFS